MKKILSLVFALGVVAFTHSTLIFAQNDRKASTVAQTFVISAKAGGVNFVEGRVAVLRKDGKSGFLLKGDTLEIGDKVTTAADGKAEILLNPGSYIRLAENTTFEFEDTSLDDLKVKLNRGSAMLEVFADDEFKVTVQTEKTQFYAVKSGVYRVDVLKDGTAKIEVWKGKAQVGDINATIVKGGREAVVNENQVAVAKFDRDEKDDLEIWSKTRAKELNKLNAKLESKVLRNTLLNSFRGGRGWNVYDSFGLWIYDASISSYCFLPFGYGWSSPYGYFYGRSIWNYRLPWAVYNNPPIWTNNGGNNNGGGGNTNNRPTVPPFERIRNGGGVSPIDRKFEPTEIYSPSISPSSPVSVPRTQPSVSAPVSQPGVSRTQTKEN